MLTCLVRASPSSMSYAYEIPSHAVGAAASRRVRAHR